PAAQPIDARDSSKGRATVEKIRQLLKRSQSADISGRENSTAAAVELPKPPAIQQFSALDPKGRIAIEHFPKIEGIDCMEHEGEQIEIGRGAAAFGTTSVNVSYSKDANKGREYLLEVFPDGRVFSLEEFEDSLPTGGRAWWSNGRQALAMHFRKIYSDGGWN